MHTACPVADKGSSASTAAIVRGDKDRADAGAGPRGWAAWADAALSPWVGHTFRAVPAFPAAGSASVHVRNDRRIRAGMPPSPRPARIGGGEWTPGGVSPGSPAHGRRLNVRGPAAVGPSCCDAVGAVAFGKAMRGRCPVCRSPWHRAVLSGASAFLFQGVSKRTFGAGLPPRSTGQPLSPRVRSPWRRVRRRGEGLFRFFRFEKRLVQPVRLHETPQRCSARKVRLQNRRPRSCSVSTSLPSLPCRPCLFCRRWNEWCRAMHGETRHAMLGLKTHATNIPGHRHGPLCMLVSCP